MKNSEGIEVAPGYSRIRSKSIPKVKTRKNFSPYFAVKRIADVVLSIIALVFLSPLFLIVAVAIKWDSPGPVFYSQERVGENGKTFKLYKFRSMYVDADKKLCELKKLNKREGPAFKISDDPRVTKVGKFIRATCIDELPQLINILKGEMSIVGPRPPLPEEVEHYSSYQLQRLQAQPGLTCYWQVHKEEASTFDDWVAMDLQYIEKQCISIDIRLILSTFGVIVKRKGEV